MRLAVTLALGLGVVASALLASLRGRGRAGQFAFYAFLTLSLDALGQMAAPLGWPVWPVMAVLVAAVAVAEPLAVAVGVAALASAMAVADAAKSGAGRWREATAVSVGYGALAVAVNRALTGEKRRLSTTLAELARLKHGIDQLDEGETEAPSTVLSLRQLSGDARRARQLDRATELEDELARLVHVAREALSAHAVLCFDVDRQDGAAHLRAWEGATPVRTRRVSLGTDPFAFVVERAQAFYATEFPKLLWSLPYYEGEVRIASLLAVPVRTGQAVSGVLVADSLEAQAFGGGESALIASFAELTADAVGRARASLAREELGVEFKAVYPLSRTLATLTETAPVRRLLLRSAQDLVAVEAAAVVMADEAQTRYVVEEASGWATEFTQREVGLSERTWAAWVLRSAEDPYLLDNVAGHRDRMPILVLDEGWGRAESLLAVPLKARNRTLGALVLTGRRGAFDAAAHRVLGLLANQAAAALSTIGLLERIKELAVRDGLTGLYNRRAFSDLLGQAIAREERQSGRFALLLLDLDHFKKLNDTFGHPAGDAALRCAAQVLDRLVRKGDQSARYGGEEFAVILPGADEAGALKLAERVREALEKEQPVFEGARLAVTASLGAAVWPQDGADGEALLAAADRALYAAKEAGRNRTVAASSLAAPVVS
ncbi:MAG TPA: sensor domain-containing diguanylate cyclase [Vicinamibacteria bacterium]|nr:sensor domain-containing diguanylate cyclase [Vicinamibacteria bacterium]